MVRNSLLLQLVLLIGQFADAFSENHVPYESHLASAACDRPNSLQDDRLIRVVLSLAIAPGVVESAAAALHDISDARSDRFAQHWTPREVHHLFKSEARQVDDVTRWLQESRIVMSRWELDIDHLLLDMTARDAEKLLRTRLRECSRGTRTNICSETYHVPETISHHIDHITVQYHPDEQREAPARRGIPRGKKRRDATKKAAAAAKPSRQVNCFKYATPECLRLLYDIPSPSTSETFHPNNSMGVFASDWLSWVGHDLDLFFADFQPSLVSHRPVMLPINGGYRDESTQTLNFHIEPNLDFGYSMALAEPLPVTDIQIGDKYLRGNLGTMLAGFDETYCRTGLDPAIDPVYPDEHNEGGYNSSDCGNRQPPLVISISWAEPEASLPTRYVRRQCVEFLKLGLQGVTVLAASGDTGPASSQGTCIDWESGTTNTSTTGRFSPNFPASCPWVTAVGGTQLDAENRTWTPGAAFPPETAFMWQTKEPNGSIAVVGSSGGGFSRLFPAPQYQTEAVASYLQNESQRDHLTSLSQAGYFDARGRGYPDVSVTANGYLMYVLGTLHQVLGTSAATPVVAAMVARINDARLRAGKRSVGFINPVLYQHGDAFLRDVRRGFNTGCGVAEAFRAGPGWDAVTGLGSVNYTRLLDFYLRLP
ncbi:hypothetical protein E4U38_006522 [Claviceps purpurea]|nr:hypothetical protein E4U38_006522 [Claviceps purpurea]